MPSRCAAAASDRLRLRPETGCQCAPTSVGTAAPSGPWHLPEKYQVAQAVVWAPHSADRVPAPIVLEMASMPKTHGGHAALNGALN